MSTGTKVIDAIIASKLMHAHCPEAPNAGCVIVWSSAAPEQIEAVLSNELQAMRDVLRKWNRLCEMGLQDVVPDWMEGSIEDLWGRTDAALGEAKP